MFLEKILNTNIGYFYNEQDVTQEEMSVLFCKHGCTLFSVEKINGLTIYKVIFDKNSKIVEEEGGIGFIFKCIHNCEIQYNRINKLPHDNWEELIDCWSCHQSEFASLKETGIKPVCDRILVSDFYCLLHKQNIPVCCQKAFEANVLKESSLYRVFYNEVNINYSCDRLIYNFFKEYFKCYSRFKMGFEDNCYEFMYLYDCLVIDSKENSSKKAIKIGYKKTKECDSVSQLNSFYMNEIEKSIEKHSINIFINEFKLTYVVE